MEGEMVDQGFKVFRLWLSGPLRGATSVYYGRSTEAVGAEGRSPQGRFRVTAVEPALLPASKEGGAASGT